MVHVDQHHANGLQAEDSRLIKAAHKAEPRHKDETTWRVAHPDGTALGPTRSISLPWLWIVASENQMLYRVGPRCDWQVIHEVVGAEFLECMLATV